MATLYRKTAKGHREIETRALKLAPRFRQLLILVDGRRSDEELAQLLPQAGAQALEALAQGGFIEAIGGGAQSAHAATQSPAFEQRRRDAVHALIEQIGPAGEHLADHMEQARSDDELDLLLDAAIQLLTDSRGRSTAKAYAQRLGRL